MSSSSTFGTESDNAETITFIKLYDDHESEIKYVYHLSDIHIRNNQRHAEYNEVFERTYKKIRTMIGDRVMSSLIVVTGDIVHAKTEMSPESISVVYYFFKNLSDIAPVILIPGNHDCNLSNRNRMDALTPIVDDIGKLTNLYYLKNTGIYQYQNILFGVTSIFDNMLISANKIDKNIWKKMKHKNKYKIALYHGPVHGAKTDVGYRMNNTELVAEDFAGYDYVMLGDIHMYQYMNKEKTVAYAGSLIQQSYGESIDNHGFLKWDLRDGDSELIKIRNDYGFCTVRIVDGKMENANIPIKPRIRFITENTNQMQYQEILSALEKEYEICEIVKETSFKTKMVLQNSPSKKKKKKISACKTQEEIIQQYLKNKINNDKEIDGIIDLHQKIYQKIFEEKKDQVFDVMHNSTKKQKWNILVLKFSNMISYGKNNIIDFQNYDPNQIIGIMAPNHYGKSAILDIILFCLFDKCSRGERKDILNKNQNDMYCSLLFRVGRQRYFIERIGKRNKNGLTVKIDVNFFSVTIDENGQEVKESLNGLKPSETNNKIVDLIGDYDDYLLTCFCLQNNQNKKGGNFIDMTHLQKKEYLQDILKLNVFEDCYNMAKDTLKKLSGQIETMEQCKINTESLRDLKSTAIALTKEIKQLHFAKTYKEDIQSLTNGVVELYKNNPMHKIDELSIYKLDTEQEILQTIDKINQKIDNFDNEELDVDAIKEEIATQKKQIIRFENDIDSIQKGIDDKQRELGKVMAKLVTIPDNHYNVNIHELAKEKERVMKRIDEINEKLEQFDNFNDIEEKNNEMICIEEEIQMLKEQLFFVKSYDYDFDSLVEEEGNVRDSLYTLVIKNMGRRIVSSERKNKIMFEMHLRKKFRKLVQINANGITDPDLLALNLEWLEDDDEWNSKNLKLLETDDSDDKLIDKLFDERRSIIDKLEEVRVAQIDRICNDNIQRQIDTLTQNVSYLKKFANYKKEIKNLHVEKKLLVDKLQSLSEKIIQFDNNVVYDESNKQHNSSIQDIKFLIRETNNKKLDLICEKKTIVQEINSKEKMIQDNEKQNKDFERFKCHLKLINKYYLSFIHWKFRSDTYKEWESNKREIDIEMTKINYDIESKTRSLKDCKNKIEEYMVFRKKYDEKSEEINLYQLYVQIMNYNGLPYEMLKTYLPLIEADTNQILHSMVNFSIEFMFYDESLVDEQKEKNMKSNMGSVNINICYQNMKPYNATLASGFERFIIGLAIRMTLGSISLTAKPNFLIIDEGWSCLDSENLNNVGSIMNYIKSQYEHVIIISHLDELKNQADYSICIDRRNGYSKVDTNRTHLKKIKN
uniref:Calcineurin-like phosphoesterase domain-containing protein n=1 Tax=viral metagenome TaxID=1070528 RepID=A0A6C0CAV2_9ZZZZ